MLFNSSHFFTRCCYFALLFLSSLSLFPFFFMLINASCQALQLQSDRWMKNFSTDSKNTSLSIRGPAPCGCPELSAGTRCHSGLNTVNWHRVTTNSQKVLKIPWPSCLIVPPTNVTSRSVPVYRSEWGGSWVSSGFVVLICLYLAVEMSLRGY